MADENSIWPALPTETEIYILPNGEIVVADLPAELAASLSELTRLQSAASAKPFPEVCDEKPLNTADLEPPHVAN